MVGGSERHRRDLPAATFAGEILIGAIATSGGALQYRDYATLPAITADLSFAHPKSLAWEKIESCARDCSLENLESLSCLDRYEGPGVAEGQVKTTIRLRFRSPERTLEQEEVNRQVQRLAAELRSRLGVQFS